jgi:hypothetical protein
MCTFQGYQHIDLQQNTELLAMLLAALCDQHRTRDIL